MIKLNSCVIFLSYNQHITFDGIHEHNVRQLAALFADHQGFIRKKYFLSFLTIKIFPGEKAYAGLNVATVMIELDDESEYELVEKPDITSTQVSG